MSNIGGYVEVVQTGTRFLNTTQGDLAVYTDCNTQSIHIGVSQTSNSLIKINNNNFTTNYSTINVGSTVAAFSNIRDVSSNWLSLSNVGTFTVCNISPFGSSNGAIDLNNGYFVFSSNAAAANSNIAHSNIVSTDFTIESWVHYYAPPPLIYSSYMPHLIGNYSNTGTANYWSFGVNCNMQLGLFTNSAGIQSSVYTPSNTVPLNTWAHIAISYSNSPKTVTFYLNGVAVSNLTASNASGSVYSVPNTSATSASAAGLTNILGPGMGHVILGRYASSNSPCYIHDFKFVTGTCYTPSNPVPIVASVTSGTRLLLRAAPVSQTSYNPLSVSSTGFVGIGTCNPLYQMDVSGSANISGFVRSSNPYYWAQMSNTTFFLKNTVIFFNSNAITNVPSAYSNSSFTVPTSGTYYISVGVLGAGSGHTGGGVGQIYLRKNQVNITRGYWQCNGWWENVNIHHVMPLLVNDKIDVTVDNNGGIYGGAGDATYGGYGSFAIFMMG